MKLARLHTTSPLKAIFWTFVLVVLMGLGFASSASASASTGAGAEAGNAVAVAANTAATSGSGSGSAPQDAPVIASPDQIRLPPIPADFSVRDLGWLKIAYPPGAEERVEPLVKDAEEVRAALGEELGQSVLDHVEVRVGRSPEEMAALSPIGFPPPAYASGVAYSGLHFVALTMRAPDTSEAPDLDEVFRHELSHVALEDATLDHHVPRWFNEGLAIYESGEKPIPRMKTLADATLSRTILPLADLDRGFPSDKYVVNIAYAESADFVRFLFRRSDRQRAIGLVARVRNGEPFDRALADAYGADSRKLEYEWKQELEKRYTIWPVVTGGGLIWVLTAGALAWAYLSRRKKSKATLARWEREEALFDARKAALARVAEDAMANARAERAAEAATATASGATSAHEDDAANAPHPASRPPMVEHDGSWHVLH